MTYAYARPLAEERPQRRLPSGRRCTRDAVVQLIIDAGDAFGLTAPLRDTLLRLISATDYDDWSDPDGDPVCMIHQQDVAHDRGRDSRTIRGHERALERLRLIERRTGNDGRRGGSTRAGERLGISFRPLIEALPQLDALRQAHKQANAVYRALRLECSCARRRFRLALDDLRARAPQHPALQSAQAAYDAWPRRYAVFRSVEELKDHLDEVEVHTNELWKIVSLCGKISAAPDVEAPPILHSTTDPLIEFCSGSSAKNTTSRKRAKDTHLAADPDGSAEGLEQDDGSGGAERNPSAVDWLTPPLIGQIAHEDFLTWLQIEARGGRWSRAVIIAAAGRRVPELGIGQHAWAQACKDLTPYRAALTVLAIDANRLHPVTPIRNPGGTLIELLRRNRRHAFNLAGMLIGLRDRTRQRETAS